MIASTIRPLPIVIGSTENALRALLVSLIDSTPVASYEQWVAINVVADSGVDDHIATIASALHRAPDESLALVEVLEDRGLVERRDERWRLTTQGASVLAALRDDVSDVTARIVAGLADRDVDATRRVLDTVRTIAIEERNRRSGTSVLL
jgi:DNA-binding MarR family transcriptional regulator